MDATRGGQSAQSGALGHILDVFNEYGVQIMTPAYEGDPAEPKVVPKEQWWSAPARSPETTDGPTRRG